MRIVNLIFLLTLAAILCSCGDVDTATSCHEPEPEEPIDAGSFDAEPQTCIASPGSDASCDAGN